MLVFAGSSRATPSGFGLHFSEFFGAERSGQRKMFSADLVEVLQHAMSESMWATRSAESQWAGPHDFTSLLGVGVVVFTPHPRTQPSCM